MEFFFEDIKKDADVRYKTKNSVIKIYIKIENNEVPVNHHRRITIVSGVFSLKDFSLIYQASDCYDIDAFNISNVLTILDLMFNAKLLNTLITCIENNKTNLSFRYFNSLLIYLKKIKKELEGGENENF
ncbi:MAG: hypothetical protein ACRCZ9_05615 [Fusobacteriaceae bacterium]